MLWVTVVAERTGRGQWADWFVSGVAKHPENPHSLSSRRFEEVIYELLRDFGYDAKLTLQTRDVEEMS
jgi:hypothetical protein